MSGGIVAREIATFFGVGRLRPAPGTWGSVAGLLLGLAVDRYLGFPALVLGTAGVTALGFWACAATLQPGEDPAEVVIDEVAGQWLALLFPATVFWWHGNANWAQSAYPGWVAAFLFFRLFDIWKPWLVGRADRRGDAAGVMLDDLWAGLFAGCATLAAAGIAHGIVMR